MNWDTNRPYALTNAMRAISAMDVSWNAIVAWEFPATNERVYALARALQNYTVSFQINSSFLKPLFSL